MRRSERLPLGVTSLRVIFAEYVRFDRANAILADTVALHAEQCAIHACLGIPECRSDRC